MRQPGLAAAFLVFSVLWPCAASLAEDGVTRQSIAGDSGLATWETDNSGVHFRLTQISPDQARAFMLGRGLDPKAADEFASTCVYMTVLRNDGRQPIKYCMVDWRYIPEDGIEQLMLTKHDWLARWKPRNFAKPVKLAFEWSQFPVGQTFAPGDWNQGMTTFELPAGSRFDVLYRWWQNGKLYEGVLQNVQCAARPD